MNGYRHILFFKCSLIAIGWALCGCDDSQPRFPSGAGLFPTRNDPPAPEPPKSQSANPLARLFNLGQSSDAGQEGNFTILLEAFRASDHVSRSKKWKSATEKHAGWENLFVVHREDHSMLYWGRYKTIEDAQANLRRAKEYVAPAKVQPYVQAIVVPVPGQDLGPPEWRLSRVPEPYVFTVLVATFYDVAEANYVGRQKFAVDYCQLLRSKGLEAYYRHDETQSIVTVGKFDRKAIVRVTDGKDSKIEIRDPRLQAVFRQFPDLAVNGRQKLITTINRQTNQRRQVPAPTYVMAIPREKKDHDNASSQPAGDHLGHPQPGQGPRDSTSPGQPAGAGEGADRPPGR